MSRPSRLVSSTSFSAADSDSSNDGAATTSMVPMKIHGAGISPTVREGEFKCPSEEEVNHEIEMFEKRRVEFNELQLRYMSDTFEWDRKKSVIRLARRLRRMVLIMVESLAFRSSPPTTVMSWLGAETDAQNYELCYQSNGLTVWKKDFGNDRVIVRGEFIIPVSPKQYCSYASDIDRRKEWDSNVSEVRKIEEIADDIDIAYVAINRIATIFPRDYINIRVINEIKAFGRPLIDHESGPSKPKRERHRVGSVESQLSSNPEGVKEEVDKKLDQSSNGFRNHDEPNRIHISRHGCWCSCSCSLEHPDIPEVPGVVRADVKVAGYLAQPLYLPNKFGASRGKESEMGEAINEAVAEADSTYKHESTSVWSRVYIFSEVDPKGWLPTAMSKHLAARVLPGTIERIVGFILDHHHAQWRHEHVYNPEEDCWRKSESALEYCYLKYLYAIE